MSKIDARLFEHRDAEIIENKYVHAVGLPSASVGGSQDLALELSNVLYFIKNGAAAYSCSVEDLEGKPETAVFICEWNGPMEIEDCGLHGPHPAAYLNLNVSKDDPLAKAFLSLLDYPCLDEAAMFELQGTYLTGLLADAITSAMGRAPDDDHFWDSANDSISLAEYLLRTSFADKLNDHIANDTAGMPVITNEDKLFPAIIDILDEKGLIVKEAFSDSPKP